MNGYDKIPIAQESTPCLIKEPAGPILDSSKGCQSVVYDIDENLKARFKPTEIYCIKCQQMVVSTVRHRSGVFSVVCSAVIFLAGGIWGCCLIPFCVPLFKDVEHVCPDCDHIIGMSSRLVR
eukprot:TRINITY_DN4054_c0_g1_i1.p1 TRINITY_DN4054_c0_g1~~TRINITY_DN4054_c0_g1_i1.p1  ORF type:complete len:131 (+),score=34.98 TRINITY_DN4054_c0_g1_i1:29-394(+)